MISCLALRRRQRAVHLRMCLKTVSFDLHMQLAYRKTSLLLQKQGGAHGHVEALIDAFVAMTTTRTRTDEKIAASLMISAVPVVRTR